MRILDSRQAKGLTQMALAKLAGVNQSTISDWERGVEPRASDLHKLAGLLEVDFLWLLTGEAAA